MLHERFYMARERAAEATPDWEKMRDQARLIKAHTMDNLDFYLEMVDDPEVSDLAVGGESKVALREPVV